MVCIGLCLYICKCCCVRVCVYVCVCVNRHQTANRKRERQLDGAPNHVETWFGRPSNGDLKNRFWNIVPTAVERQSDGRQAKTGFFTPSNGGWMAVGWPQDGAISYSARPQVKTQVVQPSLVGAPFECTPPQYLNPPVQGLIIKHVSLMKVAS